MFLASLCRMSFFHWLNPSMKNKRTMATTPTMIPSTTSPLKYRVELGLTSSSSLALNCSILWVHCCNSLDPQAGEAPCGPHGSWATALGRPGFHPAPNLNPSIHHLPPKASIPKCFTGVFLFVYVLAKYVLFSRKNIPLHSSCSGLTRCRFCLKQDCGILRPLVSPLLLATLQGFCYTPALPGTSGQPLGSGSHQSLLARPLPSAWMGPFLQS